MSDREVRYVAQILMGDDLWADFAGSESEERVRAHLDMQRLVLNKDTFRVIRRTTTTKVLP